MSFTSKWTTELKSRRHFQRFGETRTVKSFNVLRFYGNRKITHNVSLSCFFPSGKKVLLSMIKRAIFHTKKNNWWRKVAAAILKSTQRENCVVFKDERHQRRSSLSATARATTDEACRRNPSLLRTPSNG